MVEQMSGGGSQTYIRRRRLNVPSTRDIIQVLIQRGQQPISSIKRKPSTPKSYDPIHQRQKTQKNPRAGFTDLR